MPNTDPEKKREYDREWQRSNREKVREYCRKWRAENKDKARASVRNWDANHPNEKSENFRKWRETNLEKKREANRKWNSDNPDKRRESEARRRARKNGVVISDVELESVWNRYNGICYLCGKAIEPSDCHFDHVIPLSKGGSHTPDNLRPTHSKCNASKRDKLIKWIQGKLF